MKVAMVQHNSNGKSYWFEIPENLASEVQVDTSVVCDTSFGRKYGKIVCILTGDKKVEEVIIAAGAKLPLNKIVAVEHPVSVNGIKIPEYMARSVPREGKIVKRFLEYYRTGRFNTEVVVDDNGMLMDGYTVYVVAKLLHLQDILAISKS